MRSTRDQLLTALVFVGVVFAYPMLASFLSIAGLGDVSLPSVVLRVTVALLSVVGLLLMRDSVRMPRSSVMAAFALFWTMYAIRVIADGYFSDVRLPISAPTLLVYLATFSVAPALFGFAGLDARGSRTAFRLLIVFGLLTLALVTVDARTLLFSLQDEGVTRFTLEKLDPISVSTVGGTLVLLGFCGVFSVRGLAPVRRLGFAALVVMGVVVLVFGSSRGPTTATLVGLLAFALLTLSPRRSLFMLAALGAIGAVAYQAYRFGSVQFGFDLVERLRAGLDEVGGGDFNRQVLWTNAWAQFVENPVFGDSIGESSTGYYPHNLTIEALMSTGLVGTTAYLYLVLRAVFAAMSLLVRKEGHEWLALLFIQYLVISQTSGAHWSSGGHWLTMTAVIATDALGRSRERSRSRRRSRRPRPATA